MVDRLYGLCAEPFIAGDDEDDDVGYISASCSHGRERFVARGIENGDVTVVCMGFKGADMLCDRACFSGGKVGIANGVDEACFSVVDVAHEGDNRASGDERIGRCLQDLLFNRFVGDFKSLLFACINGNFAVEVVAQQLDGRLIVEVVVER